MLNFGFHLPISGGVSNAFSKAKELKINTFQIFTRSSRSWAFKPLDKEEIKKFRVSKTKFEKDFGKVVVHMPYLPNLATSEQEKYEKSLLSLIEEVKRCDQLGAEFLVAHLGSHKGAGVEKGRNNVISILEKAVELEPKVQILLENTAGTKNSVGSHFSDISVIIEKISDPTKIGVCFDTCHAFAAGYDLRTKEALDETLELFDQEIGLSRLEVIHCNDSKTPLNGKSDRHEHIGLGKIGIGGFKELFWHKISLSKPIILETPINDIRDDFANLKVVKSLI
jgi:deoxyribonuclease-4